MQKSLMEFEVGKEKVGVFLYLRIEKERQTAKF